MAVTALRRGTVGPMTLPILTALIVLTYATVGAALWLNPWLRAKLAMHCSTWLFALAVHIAGRRRRYLEADWAAVLVGVPDEGVTLTRFERLRYTGGFFVAALRMRLSDTVAPAWKPVDWLLAGESRTRTTTTFAVGAQVIYVVKEDGLHGLLTEGWGWCGGCAVALTFFFRWLRRVRGVELVTAEQSGED